MSDIIKTQAVASDLTVKEVTGLEKVERVLDDDVLLLIRPVSDGSQKCYSVKGRLFHGEDAYEIAVKNGFSGTYEDWQDAVKKVVDVQPLADNLVKVTEDAQSATADAISATEAIKLVIEQVNAAEAVRASNEAERQTSENSRKSAEDSREANEQARNTSEDARQENETARATAENKRVAAEEKREADFSASKDAADKAIDKALSTYSHPPKVDDDGYYYVWNPDTQSYNKTDVNLTGKAFSIKKVFASVADMEATDISTFNENDFILINTADVEDEDNAKLYVVARNDDGNLFYSYLVDMSGFRGFTGKTPQLIVGNVESLGEDEEAAASVTYSDVDNEGNPVYKVSFGIPRGRSFKFADFTEDQIEALKKPATDAANDSKKQTALCVTATTNANDAASTSNSQTLLCKEATDAAQEVIDKFADLIAAINIEVTGDGNAIADVSQDGSKLKFTKGNFLPLSGGRMTGVIDLRSVGTNKCALAFNNSGTGVLGIENGINALYINNYDGDYKKLNNDIDLYLNSHKVIHSGNIGQQTINLSQIPVNDGYNGKFVSVVPRSSIQYNHGYWKRCLQFRITHPRASSITFEDHPSEKNRTTWIECNFTTRNDEDPTFYKVCKIDNNRGYKYVSDDGNLFSIWIYCQKTTFDGYSNIIITQARYITDVNLEPAFQDTEPTGSYEKFASVGGYVHAAESIPTRTLWGQSFDGTGDVSGTLSKVNRIEFIGGLVDGNYAMNLRNSDVIGINALIFADPSDSSNEGVVFPRLDGKYDSVWAHNGILSFTVAKSAANTEDGTRYNVVTTSGSSSSDLRLKKNIHSLDCLDIIKNMGGTVGFEWKENNEKSIGFIAQRVQKNPHMKDLVTQDYKGYLKIDYWSPKLIAVAFGAIEQVDGEVGKLKARIRKLEQKIKKLEKNSGE